MNHFTPLTIVFGCSLGLTAWAEIEVIDDLGNTVFLAEPARRIVALVPHATEMLFEIEAQSRIVATVAFADYPEAAQALPRVGDYNALNTEAILALEPDLIIAYPGGPTFNDIEQLQRLGLTVFFSDPQSFTEISGTLRLFGQLSGNRESANTVAEQFEQGLRELGEQYSDKENLAVFFEVWHDPFYTLNGDNFVSHIIDLCGASNIFADLPMTAPQVSLEAIFAQDPDVIVTHFQRTGADSHWQQWPQMRAVASNNLIGVNPDEMHRPTPSLLVGAKKLCEELEDVRQAR